MKFGLNFQLENQGLYVYNVYIEGTEQFVIEPSIVA